MITGISSAGNAPRIEGADRVTIARRARWVALAAVAWCVLVAGPSDISTGIAGGFQPEDLERSLVAAGYAAEHPYAVRVVNRLSDLLFVLARNADGGETLSMG